MNIRYKKVLDLNIYNLILIIKLTYFIKCSFYGII